MAAAFRRCAVLVVDDDPSIRAVLADVLRDEFGADVVEAGDGADALELARQRPPDLVLLDLRMPRVDGFAFCGLLRDEPRLADVPVVVVTAASPPDEARAKALAAGCAEVVAKPFEVDDLVPLLGRYLGAA